MSDVSLARAVCVPDGTDAAERLAVLFDVHYDRLYCLARRLTSSADDAQDLVQETFLKAARFPSSIPVGVRDEEAWLVRVMINTRRDQWRKTSTRNRHDRSAISANRREPDDRGVEESLIARNTVWQALDTLSPRRRAIMVMHELEGLPIPTIASLLGVSAITVRWHLSMAKHDLIHTLKPCKGERR